MRPLFLHVTKKKEFSEPFSKGKGSSLIGGFAAVEITCSGAGVRGTMGGLSLMVTSWSSLLVRWVVSATSSLELEVRSATFGGD